MQANKTRIFNGLKKILCFMAGVILLSGLLFNSGIIKTSASSFSEGLKNTGDAIGGYDTSAKADSLTLAEKIGRFIAISTTFLGVIFLGLMIYAGATWMMARGNEQEVEKAKNIIIYAVIGLAVVLAAYALTKLMVILWGKS